MALATFQYDLAGGSTTIDINVLGKPTRASKVSYQLQGDASVNGTVTVKLQETLIHGSGVTDITGATAVANVNSSEYVGRFDVGGEFMSISVVLGTALAGIITVTIKT